MREGEISLDDAYKHIVTAATITVMGVAFVLTGALEYSLNFCILTTKISTQSLIVMGWAIIIYTLIVIGTTAYEEHEKEIT